MCIFCGGQCGGAGDLLISLGLPFLAIYVLRMKGFLIRMKNKLIRKTSPEGNLPERASTCEGCGELLSDCSHKLSPITSEWTLNQLSGLSITTTPKNNLDKSSTNGPKGVRGWLLLLCFNLIILIPAFSLYQTNCTIDMLFLPQYRILLSIWSKNYYYLNVATIFSMLFIAIYSFYCGLRLWSIKGGAVRTAKIFLIVQLSLTVAILALQQIILSQSDGVRSFSPNVMGPLVTSVLYFSVWYVYLVKSRRVYNTYGQDERRTIKHYATA